MNTYALSNQLVLLRSIEPGQFTSWEWLGLIRQSGHQPSIGRVGSALDNAMIESWFSSFTSEALHPFPVPPTRAAARQLLFQHINFHNRRRLHSALGYSTPADYERTMNPSA